MNLAWADCKSKGTAGFTLIEVLISMGILVFISFGIYQATFQTYRLRDVLATEGEFYNSIRLAMNLLQRDISLIYTPLTLLPKAYSIQMTPEERQAELIRIQNLQAQLNDDSIALSQYWSPAVDATGLRPSRLVGSQQKLSFIAASYGRIYKDTPGSDFAKIAYEIKRDEKSQNKSKSTYVLVKTESPSAFARDDLRDPLSKSYELLAGIKSFTFKYYQRNGNTWRTLNSWDSDQEQPQYSFPDFIEVTLEVIADKNLSFDGIYKFRPEMPFYGLPTTY